MSARQAEAETVVVLTGADESLPPGLEDLPAGVTVRHAPDEAALQRHLPEATVLLVTDFRTELLQRHWRQARRLRWIHATSAGVDALMFPELIESPVPVTNARGIFDAAIAEFVLGQILIFAKGFHTSLRLQGRRHWQHRDTERIAGRRALIVGAGSIGRTIARLLAAAGLTVRGVARSARRNDPDFDQVLASSQLHDALPEADFVVLATPLTADTRGLFDRHAFRAMASHSRLINIGRGPVVVTEDLLEALDEGWIAGAALDVFETEPLPGDHPIWTQPEVIVSAHMAGDFIGWREALTRQFLENFQRWQQGSSLLNQVDKQKGYAA